MIKSQYENVATALYLVTNHLKDTEPLKHRVRQISHEILEHMIHLSDMSYAHVESHTAHLQSLLRIASAAGLIAEQNASILNNALSKILKDTEQYMKPLTNMSISLSDLLYIEPASDVSLGVASDAQDLTVSPQGSERDQAQSLSGASSFAIAPTMPSQPSSPAPAAKIAAPMPAPAAPKPAQHEAPKMSFDSVASMRQAFDAMNGNGASARPSSAERPVSGGQMSDRQQIILKELRNKGQLTVKDLAEKIKGCSEKTIQRELLSLVGSGVLKKEGERRWSRYSIQQA